MKRYKPTTAGQRNMTAPSYRQTVTRQRPNKNLTRGFKRGMGRDNGGRITSPHRGGGNKRRYRFVDFVYDKREMSAKVESIEYDPNRTAYIAQICYTDGERRYIIAPGSVQVGDVITVAEQARPRPGNRLKLRNIPVGTLVYNVEFKPDGGAKLARSAGNAVEVIAHDSGYSHLKMPSSEIRKVPSHGWASVGEVSNDEHKRVRLGKAGRSRHIGRRPKVRGVAMGSHDHPHGGGEGRTGLGVRRRRTVTGRPTGIGQKTRKPKKYSNKLIVQRRKKKRRK
jgi:large subunit ribosomal protein L2